VGGAYLLGTTSKTTSKSNSAETVGTGGVS
jgi:hypothetical protein